MMKTKKKFIVLAAIVAILILLIIWIAYGNTDLEIYKYNVKSEDIPSEFDNFRIVQISDLHNTEFGENNEKLLLMLKQADADIIAITGDMIDSRNTDVDVAISFDQKAVNIAPVYYVNGNHESRVSGEYEKLKQGLTDAGVTILENSSADITIGDETISLIGINDIVYFGRTWDELKEFLKRERRNERKIAAGIALKRKGRPPKDYIVSEQDKVAELKYILARKDAKIKSLEMENELMRDFLSLTERK